MATPTTRPLRRGLRGNSMGCDRSAVPPASLSASAFGWATMPPAPVSCWAGSHMSPAPCNTVDRQVARNGTSRTGGGGSEGLDWRPERVLLPWVGPLRPGTVLPPGRYRRWRGGGPPERIDRRHQHLPIPGAAEVAPDVFSVKLQAPRVAWWDLLTVTCAELRSSGRISTPCLR